MSYNKETRTIVHEAQEKANKRHIILESEITVLKFALTRLQDIFLRTDVTFIALSILTALSDALLKLPITQEFIRLSPGLGIMQIFTALILFTIGIVFIVIGSVGRVRCLGNKQ